MEKKTVAKKYLITIFTLFAFGVLLVFILFYALNGRYASGTELTTAQLVAAALGAACLPAGSYAGFVIAGLKLQQKEKPSKGVIIAVCIFFPVTLAILTVFGIIMIIPSILYSIYVLSRG